MEEQEPIIDRIYPDDIEFKFLQSFDSKEFGFILKTFTQGLHLSYPYKNIPNSIFFPQQTKILKSIISNGAKVLIATLKDNEDHFFGYAIVDDRISEYLIVHWLHTKHTWHKMGVAKELLNYFKYKDKKIIISNITDDFKNFKKKINMTYNPYLWII